MGVFVWDSYGVRVLLQDLYCLVAMMFYYYYTQEHEGIACFFGFAKALTLGVYIAVKAPYYLIDWFKSIPAGQIESTDEYFTLLLLVYLNIGTLCWIIYTEFRDIIRQFASKSCALNCVSSNNNGNPV